MKKTFYDKYLNHETNVYNIVDQDFLLGFNDKQATFMLITYYMYYKTYCEQTGNAILPMDTFLINARRRKIKLIQQCCPYCGRIGIMLSEQKISDIKEIKYCVSCGKKSTAEIVFEQIASLIRMSAIHHAGLETLMAGRDQEKKRLLGYDIMLTEMVQLTSILETTLREFYMDLVCIKYRCYNTDFLLNIIEKDTKNDFMNFDKANNHYKKALGLNLKQLVSVECRANLIDLVNVRNVVAHNNGKIDDKFKNSITYERLKDYVNDDLLFITPELIDKYLEEVLTLIIKIENEYNERFSKDKYFMISNYYFNLEDIEDKFHFETFSTKCGRRITLKVNDYSESN